MSITGLNIRRRLRRRFVRLLDRGIALLDPSGAAERSRAAPEPVNPPAPAQAPAPAPIPTPATAAPAVQPERAAPLKPLPTLAAPEPRSAKPADEPKPSPAERQARHWERTRKGLLRFIHERGGSATLHDLHEHSESTYFVAHVSFSRMMEELTGGGQLGYDHDTATATLTEAGRAEL